MFAVFHDVRFLRTVFKAPAAPDAFFRDEGDLLPALLRFRVMTPQTLQRTALQEYGSAYSRPVMYREFLNIKNHAFHCNTP